MGSRDFFSAVRARYWVVLLAIVVATAIAVVVSMMQPKTYAGEASVLLSENDAEAAVFGALLPEVSSKPERGVETQMRLIRLRPLAEATIEKLDLSLSADELLEGVRVVGESDSSVIVVRATDADPEQAADIANALAQAYVDWSKTAKQERIRAAADEVEARLESAQADAQVARRRIAEDKNDDDARSQLEIATASAESLAAKLDQLRIDEKVEQGSGRIVGPAVADSSPDSPQPLRNAGFGLVIGTIIGLILVPLIERFDDTVKTAEDAKVACEAPVLGRIPVDAPGRRPRGRLALSARASESYRLLRNAMDFLGTNRGTKTVLVTSAASHQGQSAVAANLASMMAQTGSKVALLSCNPTASNSADFFGHEGAAGLAEVLAGHAPLDSVLRQPLAAPLVVLSPGGEAGGVAGLVCSDRMRDVVDAMGSDADWVLLEAPSVLDTGDATALAQCSDGVLLVVEAGTTLRRDIRRACEELRNVGAEVLGVVVLGLDPSSADGALVAPVIGEFGKAFGTQSG